ncbi:MAG: hypothetical protein EOP46_09070 [Sphingobacteriaceae bacterium]|nr:MAG: hypothetical protein EOP46_09070 [Sphingobacteriaceae bacterium]
MKKKVLILPIETKAREFEPRLLLASHAVKQGYVVYIGSKAAVNKNHKNIKPGVLFHKDAWKSSLNLINNFKNKGSKIVGTDEEGLVVLSDQIYLNQRIDIDTLNLFDQFYMWGDHQKEVIATKFKDTSKLLSTGNSRVDFLRKELDYYAEAQINELKEQYGSFVMINTKLSAYNHGRGPEGYIDMFRSQGMFKTKEDELFRYEFQGYIKELFFKYQELLTALAKAFPNTNFVLRPHPSENQQVWVDYCKDIPNVHVDGRGNISTWIKACKAVIHTDCTTGIESVIAGIPTIAYRPTKPKKEEMFLPNALSREVKTEEELVDLLAQVLNAGPDFELLSAEQHALLNEYVSHHKGGTLASDAIVEAMSSMNPPEYPVTSIKSGNKMAATVNRIKKKLTFGKPAKNDYGKQKFPSMSLAEAEGYLNRLTPGTKYDLHMIDDNFLYIGSND